MREGGLLERLLPWDNEGQLSEGITGSPRAHMSSKIQSVGAAGIILYKMGGQILMLFGEVWVSCICFSGN